MDPQNSPPAYASALVADEIRVCRTAVSGGQVFPVQAELITRIHRCHANPPDERAVHIGEVAGAVRILYINAIEPYLSDASTVTIIVLSSTTFIGASYVLPAAEPFCANTYALVPGSGKSAAGHRHAATGRDLLAQLGDNRGICPGTLNVRHIIFIARRG